MDLKKLHKKELEILIYISGFCKEKDINFFLIGGSLLGAVRHSGFIPWDDDIDIGMSRDNYQKFISLYENEKAPYNLRTDYSGQHYPYSFAKVQDKNINGLKERAFIDVFPFDKMSTNKMKAYFQFIEFKIVNSRIISLMNESTGSLQNKVIDIFFKNFFPKVNVTTLTAFRKKIMVRSNRRNGNFYNIASQYGFEKERILEKNIDKFVLLSFEGHKMPTVVGYEEMLRVQYGDYMKIPPEKDQVMKHLQEIKSEGDS